MRWLARLFLLLVVGYLTYSLFVYGLGVSTDRPLRAFAMLGAWRTPFFDDLRWVLSFSDCDSSLEDVVAVGGKCNGYVSPEYPIFSILGPRWLGLGPADASWIGLSVGLMLVISLCFLARGIARRRGPYIWVLSLLLISYPVQAILERANIDALIFLVLVIVCLLFVSRVPWPWFCLPLAGACIALKVYPFFGLICLALFVWCRYRLVLSWRLYGLALMIVALVALIVTMKTLIEPPAQLMSGSIGSHGLLASGYVNMALIDSFGIDVARWLIRLLILTKVLVVAMALVLFSRAYLKNLVAGSGQFVLRFPALSSPFYRSLLVLGTGIGLGCYVFSIGYDYRLVFIFPAIFLLASDAFGPSVNDDRCGLRRLACFQVLSLIYIVFLPFLFFFYGVPGLMGIHPSVLAVMELLDEFVLAPFLFAGLLPLLLVLIAAPPTLRQSLHASALTVSSEF